VGDTQGAVGRQGGVGGGRQVGGEDNQGEGKPGREVEEGEVGEAEAAGGVLGPEVVSHPCHHRRSPCPLQKSMEKPVGVQRVGGHRKATACVPSALPQTCFLSSPLPSPQGLPCVLDPRPLPWLTPALPGSVRWPWEIPGQPLVLHSL
jgi:hypothetical protein